MDPKSDAREAGRALATVLRGWRDGRVRVVDLLEAMGRAGVQIPEDTEFWLRSSLGEPPGLDEDAASADYARMPLELRSALAFLCLDPRWDGHEKWLRRLRLVEPAS